MLLQHNKKGLEKSRPFFYASNSSLTDSIIGIA